MKILRVLFYVVEVFNNKKIKYMCLIPGLAYCCFFFSTTFQEFVLNQ